MSFILIHYDDDGDDGDDGDCTNNIHTYSISASFYSYT